MKSFDFEYNGLNLSDFGYIICTFGSEGIKTISNGSVITFNSVSTLRGKKFELTSTEFNDCLETTFQICKNPCKYQNLEMSIDEVRTLSKWLNREGFYKFKILNDDYQHFYFEASFNIKQIEFRGKVYGLELELKTNRPFALQEPYCISFTTLENNEEKIVKDYSDVEGYLYPEVEITINESGDLKIINEIENRTTSVLNCVAGEVIKMNYPIIETSRNDHKIQNDFNWNFLRIANTFNNSVNKLIVSIPCTISIKYSAHIKVGI